MFCVIYLQLLGSNSLCSSAAFFSCISGEKSPRPSASSHQPSSADKRQLLVTPAAATLNANRLNKVSPYDVADRLISCERDGSGSGRGGSASPLTGIPPAAFPRSSRLTSRQQQQQQQSLSSFAKLRALRDDDSSAGEEDQVDSAVQSFPTKVCFTSTSLCAVR